MRYLSQLPAILSLTLLTACSGLIGAIIGERPVENLFGLDGKEVVFRLPETLGQQPGELFPAQDPSFPINVSFEVPFEDLENINLPLGAVPRAASEELGIRGTLEMTSASGESAFPARLGLANPELDLTLTDGSGAPSVRLQVQSPDVSVTFNKSSCETSESNTVCTYQTAESEYYFFTLELEGQDFETLFNNILQAGAETNNANGVVTLFVSTSLENALPVPLDSSFKLVLETRNGKIRFF